MTTESLPPSLARAREEFDALVRDIRPQLHRYCARMTGSVVDGEDVVQDALAKAYYTLPTLTSVSNLRGWLFRIAHNKAIDHMRRYDRQHAEPLDDYPLLATQDRPLEDQEVSTMALSLFLKLTPAQRSSVFLKDVMGHSLAEISELHDASITAVKAVLHRGRARLRELAESTGEDDAPPRLEEPEASLLARYVERFNARDFDAVRAMLADDVRLDLIGRAQSRGTTEVGGYCHRYNAVDDWQLRRGFVEGRPAILVFDPRDEAPRPSYFVLIEWTEGRAGLIRDYRYARHVMRDAEVVVA